MKRKPAGAPAQKGVSLALEQQFFDNLTAVLRIGELFDKEKMTSVAILMKTLLEADLAIVFQGGNEASAQILATSGGSTEENARHYVLPTFRKLNQSGAHSFTVLNDLIDDLPFLGASILDLQGSTKGAICLIGGKGFSNNHERIFDDAMTIINSIV